MANRLLALGLVWACVGTGCAGVVGGGLDDEGLDSGAVGARDGGQGGGSGGAGDAGFGSDAGQVVLDAGTSAIDGGANGDGGNIGATDASVDAGSRADAGRPDSGVTVDAGALDAGAEPVDAGPRDAGQGPPPGGDGGTDAFTFLVYGDSRSGSDCSGNQVHLSLVQRMANETDAAFVVHLGDMVTGYSNTTNWVQGGACTQAASTGSLKTQLSPLTSKSPAPGLPTFVFPVVGNHDDSWGEHWYPDSYGQGFCDVFPKTLMQQLIPNHTQQPYFEDKTGRNFAILSDSAFYDSMCSTTQAGVYPTFMYYSFDYQHAHFSVLHVNTDYLDLEECGGCAGNQSNYEDYYYIHQLHWLRADLDAAKARGQKEFFVFLHAPLLTTSDGHDANASAPTLRKLFTQYGVTAVFSGHDHVYERSHPTAFDSASPDGRIADGGTTYLVTGGGGSDPHGFRSTAWFDAKRSSDFHYTRVTVNGSHLTTTAIDPSGQVVEQYSR